MRRFYIYNCVVDDGGAPCVDHGLFSLCICKPRIRSTARKGDIIFAFGSNSEKPANRFIYIAAVARKLTQGEYYELDEYADRGDCIYERNRNGRFHIRKDARFHGSIDAMEHDIGQPPKYARANSLVSNDFRYFGKKGTDAWKARSPELKQLVESLGEGHRVNHAPTLRAELHVLWKSVWREYDCKILGKPLHQPGLEVAQDEDEDEPLVKVCQQRCYYVTSKC